MYITKISEILKQEAITKAQESQYSEVATILRSAYPAAAPSAGAGRDWLQTFAENLKKELESQAVLRQKEEALESRLKDLVSQNEYLQSLVDKYKKIIDDTVSLFYLLFASVWSEGRWRAEIDLATCITYIKACLATPLPMFLPASFLQ